MKDRLDPLVAPENASTSQQPALRPAPAPSPAARWRLLAAHLPGKLLQFHPVVADSSHPRLQLHVVIQGGDCLHRNIVETRLDILLFLLLLWE